MDDAELARLAGSGDRGAWAAIYDRYADRLHDYCHSILRDRHEAADALHEAFVTAATKIGQLRDPERLRPWLYAICRTQSLAMVRRRSRELPSEDVAEMTPATTDQDEYAAEELRRLVWDAAGGLAPRDRSVLDLHLRHGLDGQELGEALGVNAHHATVQLARVRAQVERSLGALLVGRTGRRDCPELDALLASWDGTLSPLLRKRVARHIDGCAECGERRRRMVSPLALLGSVPVLPAPPELRDRVLDDVALRSASRPLDAGRPAAGRRLLVVAAAGVAALVAAGALLFAVARPGGQRPLAGSAETGTTSPATTTTAATPTAGSAEGVAPPAATTSSGPSARTVTSTTASRASTTTVRPADSRPPAVTGLATSQPWIVFNNTTCGTVQASALVTDESPVTVVLTWRTASGASHEAPMSQRPGGRYSGSVGPVSTPTEGPLRWWITATDARGNSTRTAAQTLPVQGPPCPTP